MTFRGSRFNYLTSPLLCVSDIEERGRKNEDEGEEDGVASEVYFESGSDVLLCDKVVFQRFFPVFDIWTSWTVFTTG